jgi:hypothetical protein
MLRHCPINNLNLIAQNLSPRPGSKPGARRESIREDRTGAAKHHPCFKHLCIAVLFEGQCGWCHRNSAATVEWTGAHPTRAANDGSA